MTRLLAAALLLAGFCAAASALAQIPAPPADAAPSVDIPTDAVQRALAEPLRRGAPSRFAVAVPVGLTLADGRWQSDGVTAVWRLRIHSTGARSLSLRLAPLAIPPGGRLRLLDPSGAALPRTYGSADAQSGVIWTPAVESEALVLEASVPIAQKSLLQLGISDVFHGYRDWQAAAPEAGVTAKTSGSCNINVACPDGDAWTAEARSVALITIANQFLCSGQLVNNVRQDQAPLFLTADHCGIGSAEHDVGNAGSVNFYFDYQAPTCSAPPQPRPTVPNVQGSTLLADDVQSDFTLLKLNLGGGNLLPADAYFAGWSALVQGSPSGAAIHHPGGDEKKISVYSTPVAQAAVDIGARCSIDAWQVEWSAGTTEGGSSGAGLWSSTHHLIGVLSGGNASCSNAGGADYFARIDRAWTASASPDGQLKAHLDPDGTCIAEIPGLDPQVSPNASPITSGPTRCEGQASTCPSGGGGAMTPWLLAALLAAAWRRAADRRGAVSARPRGRRRPRPPPSPRAAPGAAGRAGTPPQARG